MDIYARATEIRIGILDATFIARLDQEAMAFREECTRSRKTIAEVAEEIFRAADEDPYSDDWLHAEAVAAWVLLEPVAIE